MTYHYNRCWHHKKICNCPQLTTDALVTKSTISCPFLTAQQWLCIICKRDSSFRRFHFTFSIYYLDTQGTAETETASCTRGFQDWENCQSGKRQTDTGGEQPNRLISFKSHSWYEKYIHCQFSQGGGIFRDPLNYHLKPIHIQFSISEPSFSLSFSSANLK